MSIMHKVLFRIAVFGCAAGCVEDSLATAPRTETRAERSVIDAIFDAAHADVPIERTGTLIVGIPEEGRGADEVRVSYDNGDTYSLYAFTRIGDGWRRGRELVRHHRLSSPTGRATSMFASNAMLSYTNSIATISDSSSHELDDDWYINDKVTTGDYTYSEEYYTVLPFYADFHEGQQESGDTTFIVDFTRWVVQRFATPTFLDSTTSASTNTFETINLHDWGANSLKARYHLDVWPPVTAYISGTTSIVFSDSSYYWDANASGGSGSYTYAWYRKVDGGAWSGQIGSASTYSEVVDSGSYTLYLRAVVSSVTKVDTTAAYAVTVDARGPRLTTELGGPTVITTAGTYEWAALPNTSVGGLSYAWYERIDYEQLYPPCEYLTEYWLAGTDSTYSRYVGDGEYDFGLTLIVNAGAQQASDEIKVYALPDDDPLCPEQPLLRPSPWRNRKAIPAPFYQGGKAPIRSLFRK